MAVLRAPRGVRSFVPDEMTVSCGAGTSIDDLNLALAESGQYVNLPRRSGDSGTVGGALEVGEGDIYRLGRGSVRDVLLQAVFVDSRGVSITAGGPTVKNVSGFDLCRLLVGSCGRLGFLAEVVLRTRPCALATRWFTIEDASRDVVAMIMAHVNRPTSVLWDGHRVHLCLEGHPGDIDETVGDLRNALARQVLESVTPDLDRFPHRWICPPRDVHDVVAASLGKCVAEIGTGIIHHTEPEVTPTRNPAVLEIEQRLIDAFDPEDRLNGGSAVWGPMHLRRARTAV
jgi:glycolate oxidase FAD binding subunit